MFILNRHTTKLLFLSLYLIGKLSLLCRSTAFLLKSIQQRGFIVRELLFGEYAMKTPLVRKNNEVQLEAIEK